MIAAGGVNQATAADFVLAGVSALGIGTEPLPTEALQIRQENWICELARRFTLMVRDARAQMHVNAGWTAHCDYCVNDLGRIKPDGNSRRYVLAVSDETYHRRNPVSRSTLLLMGDDLDSSNSSLLHTERPFTIQLLP